MSTRQSRVEDVFHQASELPKDARSAFLAEVCRDEPEVRVEVEGLLSAADLDVEGFVARLAADATEGEGGGGGVPERIGEFRIVRVVGEGGMGRVYEARQDVPARRVALKVIRPGLVSTSALRRFAHETNVLAQLSHPGIAQILQAGFARDPARPDGSASMPYFAMEFIDGPPISEYVRAERLGVRAILGLLADICDAVQHAHQRGVIHRDLKPGNILVSSASGAPVPKILDFGIARLTDPESARMTVQTQAGQIVGTLGYMSPEQTDGSTGSVDTRADIYALGVIAYELLAGRSPLDLSNRSIASAISMVRDTEPVRLGSLRPELAGDVETIVGKAMAKDRESRYASAGELANDLRNVLADRPIAARPPSTVYVLRKFARRNRPLVALAGLAVVSLIGGAGVSAWQAVVATRQRDAAVAAQTRADLLRRFLMEDVFGQTRFDQGGVKLTVVDALKKAAERVPTKFADQPTLHAEIAAMLVVMMNDAAMPEAIEQSARAQSLHIAAFGPDDPRTLRVMLDRAAVLSAVNRTAEMDTPLEDLARRVDQAVGPTTLEAIKAHTLLAVSKLQGNAPQEAAAVLGSILDRPYSPEVLGHISYGYMLNIMTSTQRALGDAEGTLEWSQRTVDWMNTHQGPGSPHTASVKSVHANLLAGAGRFAEAEPILRDALATQRKLLRPNDDSIGYTAMHLAMVLVKLGRAEEALPFVTEGARNIEAVYGINDWETWLAWRREWTVLDALKDAERLEAWHVAHVERTARMEPRLREHALDAVRWHAEFRLLSGDLEGAERMYAGVREELMRMPPDWHTRVAAELLDGMIARRKGRTEEARRTITRVRDFFREKPFPLYPGIADRAEAELKAIEGGQD